MKTTCVLVSVLLLGSCWADDFYSCDYGAKLEVTLGAFDVDCGTAVSYSTAHYVEAPLIKLASAVDGNYYVVAMIDPDAPSADDPTYREVRHFLVGNVNGTTLREVGLFDPTTNTVLSPFLNPSPPEGSGFHRYVQHVYSQGASTIDFVPVGDDVLGFNLTAWASQYDLGDPIGSNYFITQFECSAEFTQCGGGANAENPICCDSEADTCFEQNAYFWQCLTTCPDEEDWACNQ